ATAIKIGNPANWGPALEAVKDSHGWIDVVSDEEILRAYRMLAREEGIFMEPASAATLAGLIKCVKAGRLEPGSTVVLTLTGHAPGAGATSSRHARLRRGWSRRS